MRLYLHIGTEKTGSSSIQTFFALNRDRLAANDVLYPRSPGTENHTALAALAQSRDRGELWRKLGIRDRKDRDRFGAQMEENLGRELAGSRAGKIILSNEHCSSRLKTVEEVETLKHFLGKFFDDIHVVVYLRRQDDYLVSSYSTFVKTGETDPLSLPNDKILSTRYDYDVLLSRWSSVFGRDRMICRKFDRSILLGGNVVNDFLHATGIGASPEYESAPETNVSLDAACLEFLRLMNKHGDAEGKKRGIVRALEAMSTGPLLDLPDGLRADLMRRLRSSNRAVAQAYFGGALTGSDDPLFGRRTDTRPRVHDHRLNAAAIEAIAAGLMQSPLCRWNAKEALREKFRRDVKRIAAEAYADEPPG